MNGPSRPATTSDRFRKNITSLLALVRELIGDCFNAGYQQVNPKWITNVIQFLDPIPNEMLIETFIDYSFIDEENRKVCIWDRIHHKDEDFIIQHANFFFRNLPVSSDKVSAFKVVFKSVDSSGKRIINDHDREAVWKHMNAIVRTVLVYIHEQRCPKEKPMPDGTMKKVYTREYRRDIDLKLYLQNYPDLELKWYQ